MASKTSRRIIVEKFSSYKASSPRVIALFGSFPLALRSSRKKCIHSFVWVKNGRRTSKPRQGLQDDRCNSAPGHSQISYQVLKWAWNNKSGQEHITALIQKCLHKGYHPKAWQKAVAVTIPKPNKPDYSNPRAYRLITLLECLAKILERSEEQRLNSSHESTSRMPSSA